MLNKSEIISSSRWPTIWNSMKNQTCSCPLVKNHYHSHSGAKGLYFPIPSSWDLAANCARKHEILKYAELEAKLFSFWGGEGDITHISSFCGALPS